ncbi:S9 family peptidase [Microbulbifer bruguierae]|uniref:S9 family peptidase n=1 Tax=Microbulbifer bruguierae TaxID=3029061 RepID=A0ABY8NAZ8_9GAMM|nr:S9 family peptidase [Microbulbifer bruguierae]WGL15620.1 S9 family peptidase [Microbulbifer bruguierae]
MRKANWLVVVLLLGSVAGCQREDKAEQVEMQQSTAMNQQELVAEGTETTDTENELIPRTELFGNPEKFRGRISPDGKSISWVAAVDGVMNIWVAPADAPENARAITSDSGRGVHLYFWAPDSKSLVYLQDKGGNENDHLYKVALESEEVVDLTPMGDDFKAQILGLSYQRPEVVTVGLNVRNTELFDIYEIDLDSGKQTLVMENPGYGDWLLDNNLVPRLGYRNLADGGLELVSVHGDNAGDVVFTIASENMMDSNVIGFDGDNRHVYLTDSSGRDKAALVKLDTETGDTSVLAESDKASIDKVFQHPITHAPIAYSVNYLKTEWYGLGTTGSEQIGDLSTAISGSLQILSSTADGKQWVVYADDPQTPGSYFVFDSEKGEARLLFNTQPALATRPLQPMQALEIEAGDGLQLVSYLTLPAGSDSDMDGIPEQPVPLALTVHGGPWARDEYGYNSWHQWLSDRGYAVLSVNYRGSSGFGKSFTNAAIGEFAGLMHRDLLDAVEWTVEQGIADKNKVAIMGGSYGGYATLIGVSHTPDTFACGVDIVGPSNLATLIESFPDYWKPWLAGTWYKFVGNPSDPAQREEMIARSAISKVNQIKVPLLIGQGENDPRVIKAESDQIVAAMEAKKLPVTYVNYPDEGHGFTRPENRLSFYAITESFLADCLGGEVEPFGDAFANSSLQVLNGQNLIAGLSDALVQEASEVEAETEE